MQKALIYCRVSTQEQAHEGYSLEAQEKYCRQFAQSNGYTVVGVYRDEGKSGTTLDRPALKDLLSKAQQENSIHAVIVQETDRLARNTKDHLTVRALLKKTGVKLVSVAQPMLDDSPEGRMVDTIIASVNQFQSDINSRKTQKSLQEKFDSGWWPGWAPLGYLNKKMDGKGVIVPDPEKWPLVRKGLKMYLTGNYSAWELSEILHKKGLTSRTGKRICNSVMTHILRNPFYAGLMRWSGQEKRGKHKPVISLKEHRQILAMMDSHNRYACRRRKHDFLLRGFVLCNICGGRYTTEKHPSKNKAYYHCAFEGKRGKEKAHTNRGQNIEVATLERQVEEKFKGIQFNDDFIKLVAEKVRKLNKDHKENLEAQKRRLLNQKLAIERKRDMAEEKLLDGVISDKDFGRMRDKFRAELDRIRNQIADLESQRELDIDVVQGVLKLARNIHEAYKTAPYELKRQYLGLFWDRFLVQDKKIAKAIPTKLIQALLKEKRVIITATMLPSPKLIITLENPEYMSMMKERLLAIKRF